MRIRLIIKEVKSWADEDKVREADEENKYEKDFNQGIKPSQWISKDRTARDSLKRHAKRARGANLEKLSLLFDKLKKDYSDSFLDDNKLGNDLYKIILDFLDVSPKEELNFNLIQIIKFLKTEIYSDTKDYGVFVWFLISLIKHFYTFLSEKTISIYRKIISRHRPYDAYWFASEIDKTYHQDTLNGIIHLKDAQEELTRTQLHLLKMYLTGIPNIPRNIKVRIEDILDPA